MVQTMNILMKEKRRRRTEKSKKGKHEKRKQREIDRIRIGPRPNVGIPRWGSIERAASGKV